MSCVETQKHKDNTSAKHRNYKCNNGNAEIFVECSADITYEQQNDDVDVLSDTNVNDNVGFVLKQPTTTSTVTVPNIRTVTISAVMMMKKSWLKLL